MLGGKKGLLYARLGWLVQISCLIGFESSTVAKAGLGKKEELFLREKLTVDSHECTGTGELH